jgi:hypothetical protein
MTPIQRYAATLAAALTLTGPALGDEVTDQIDSARKSYESGELRIAVDTLNFAVAKIQERMTSSLLLLLPEPLPGWQADPAQSESAGLATMITGTSLSRRYFREDGAEVSLTLMADSPMLPMLTMFLSSPFMMQASPETKPFSIKGMRGMVKQEQGGGVEITLMVGSRILIQGKGSGTADRQAVQGYLEALEIEKIQRALGV